MTLARRLAAAVWDDTSYGLAVLRHRRPATVRLLGFAAEVLQRPMRALRVGDTPVRLAFAGNDRQLFAALARTFGVSDARLVGGIPWGVRGGIPDADVECAEIPSWDAARTRAAGALVLPRWVGMAVDLDCERLDERRRALFAQAERRGLVAEVVPAPRAIDEFVERFYAPTALARHAGDAFVYRPRFLRRAARSGHILFVRDGCERLAGILLVRRDAAVWDAWVSGVLGGDYVRVDPAVRVALHAWAMRFARECGASVLGLTTAQPFLGDGLLRYKRSLGARVTPITWHPTALRVVVRRASPAAVAALTRSPPIHLGPRGLAGVAIAHGRPGFAASPRFAVPGVDGPYVLCGPEASLPALLARWAATGAAPVTSG